jgi:anti-sigma factor RsiW
MNREQQLKLQAFLDGELPDGEAREVLAWIQRDEAAAALLAELKNTRQAMAKAEPYLSVPESREFYWSKIQREIQRLEPRESSAPAGSVFATLRRLLVPAGVFAALAIALLVAYPHFRPAGKTTMADASEVVTTLADADAVTYRDEQEGTTLIWLSYPADVNSGKNKPAHS